MYFKGGGSERAAQYDGQTPPSLFPYLHGAQALHLLADVDGALAVPVAARVEGGLGLLQVQGAVLHELLGVARRVHKQVVELSGGKGFQFGMVMRWID